MDKLAARMEKFLFILLLINPFFDLIGGVFIYINYEDIIWGRMPLFSPALYIRMAVLAVFIAYILINRDKKSILFFVPIGIAWAFTIAGELMFAANFDALAEVKYLAKFIFNISVILVYWRVFQRSKLGKEQLLAKINWIFAFSSLWITAFIIICSIANIGYDFRIREDLVSFSITGTRGFFYSGNDLAGIVSILFPLTIAFYLKMKNGLTKAKQAFWLLTPAIVFSGLLQIGMKTTILAAIITVAGMLLYVIIHWIKQKDALLFKRLSIIIVTAVVINFAIIGVDMLTPTQSSTLLSIKSIEAKDDLVSQRVVEAKILDENVSITEPVSKQLTIQEVSDTNDSDLGVFLFALRQEKIVEAFTDFNDGGAYAYLFGIGRGSQERTVEMDLVECLIYYGIIGSIVMLWLYVKLGIGFIRKFLRKIDAFGVALFISLGLAVGYLTIAGHILFSVSAGFYFALVLLYSALYYADDVKKLDILNCKLLRKRK